jgi:ATP-binding protein involved in chromosome partitioning
VADPARIEVDGTTVTIEWDDDRVDVFDATVLRLACPCAGCREPASTAKVAAAGSVSVTGARLVGGYAINLTFGPDGHATGIYPFTLLRDLGEVAGNG